MGKPRRTQGGSVPKSQGKKARIGENMRALLFANTDWYLYNFRLGFAKYLRDKGVEVTLVSPPGPYGKRLTDEGFEWIPLEMERKSLNPMREVLTLYKLYNIIKKKKPDLIHNFTIKCVVYGAAVARLAGVKYCVHAITGMGFVYTSPDLKARVLRPIVSKLLQKFCSGENVRVIVQNPDDYHLLLNEGIVEKSGIVLIKGSGVNTKRFRPSYRSKDERENKIKILFVGRLLLDKGFEEFSQVAERTHELRSDLEYYAAGSVDEGNPASIPLQRINQLKQKQIINFLGHVEKIEDLLAGVDIVILPSYREGLPRSLIEAAASCKVLIATDVPGCREIVIDGETGVLVPVKNSEAILTAIEKLVQDESEMIRLSSNAREFVLKNLDEEIVFIRTLEVYNGIGVNDTRVNEFRVNPMI